MINLNSSEKEEYGEIRSRRHLQDDFLHNFRVTSSICDSLRVPVGAGLYLLGINGAQFAGIYVRPKAIQNSAFVHPASSGALVCFLLPDRRLVHPLLLKQLIKNSKCLISQSTLITRRS